MTTLLPNGVNPWTGHKMTKKPSNPITLAELSICNDPLPTRRVMPGGKYTELFGKLQPGQCIKCPSGAAGRLGQALRKWIEANKSGLRVSSTDHYEADGLGRVWLLDKSEA